MVVYNDANGKRTSQMKGNNMATEKKNNATGKASDKFNIYQEVTDRIIEQLKNGEIPWNKPWTGIANGAFNRVSKKPYSLLNQMLLLHDGEYATYKQWSELGGQVRKGEKSEIVVFWKIIQIEDESSNPAGADNSKGEKKKKKSIPILKYYRVFHISQVDGVEPLENGIATEHEPIEEAEKIKREYMEREGLQIKNVLSNSAFYSPMGDYINMPLMEQFTDINEYYSTLFHETVHSTGHKSRLDRFGNDTKLAAFGSQDYSKEELVAELGSSFLMNHIGIDTEKTFKNSAAYIQGWLAALSNDNRLIVSAASRAEKAVNYILNGKENKNEVEVNIAA